MVWEPRCYASFRHERLLDHDTDKIKTTAYDDTCWEVIRCGLAIGPQSDLHHVPKTAVCGIIPKHPDLRYQKPLPKPK